MDDLQKRLDALKSNTVKVDIKPLPVTESTTGLLDTKESSWANKDMMETQALTRYVSPTTECNVGIISKIIIGIIMVVFVVISVADTAVDVADATVDTVVTTGTVGVGAPVGIATNFADLAIEVTLEIVQLLLVLAFNWLVPEEYKVSLWVLALLAFLGIVDIVLTVIGFAPYADWAEVIGEVPTEAIQSLTVIYYGLTVILGC